MMWLGIGVAILIAAGWIIYSRRKGTVTLTRDQASMVLGLVQKECTEIEKKRQAIIDQGAAQGKKVSLDKVFSQTGNLSDPIRQVLEKRKAELYDRYGAEIPVDVAYRLMKQFDPDEQSPWSENPGCFERHLQRREGNLLFPPERRLVTQEEINEAKEKDRIEQQQYAEKVRIFAVITTEQKSKNWSLSHASAILQEVQALIEEGASIGGDIGHCTQVLESTEKKLMLSMSEAFPDGADLLRKAESYSAWQRVPYFAQSIRKDSPILKGEEISALLSEDFDVISLAGYMSRAFAPNYRPNESDIRNHLDVAVRNGFSKDRAAQIMLAWNET